jgi:signal transduction histidine kinase
MFVPFQKFDKKKDHLNIVAGLGIGLTLSKVITEALGGSLEVFSNLG